MLTISYDWDVYLQHKPVLDGIALAMQQAGNRVGIITGEREKHADPSNTKVIDKKQIILDSLGFKPDFIRLFGEIETIASVDNWKAQKMDEEGVDLHFDDDGTGIKRQTSRWVAKLMLNGQENKF